MISVGGAEPEERNKQNTVHIHTLTASSLLPFMKQTLRNSCEHIYDAYQFGVKVISIWTQFMKSFTLMQQLHRHNDVPTWNSFIQSPEHLKILLVFKNH